MAPSRPCALHPGAPEGDTSLEAESWCGLQASRILSVSRAALRTAGSGSSCSSWRPESERTRGGWGGGLGPRGQAVPSAPPPMHEPTEAPGASEGSAWLWMESGEGRGSCVFTHISHLLGLPQLLYPGQKNHPPEA